MYKITLLPSQKAIYAEQGENLLNLLRKHGFVPDAPCGGQGTCGKCVVSVNGIDRKSCQTEIISDITVTMPQKQEMHILAPEASDFSVSNYADTFAAIDIGTTTVVCSLLDAISSTRLSVKAAANPQAIYGADVVSRIRSALSGTLKDQSTLIRDTVENLIYDACLDAQVGFDSIQRICIVGNPAMQQLFLGISPQNLVEIPFLPVLTKPREILCKDYLPMFPLTVLQVVPDISGYIGADTVGCILSAGMQEKDAVSLMVDIGTNGEMVLGNRERLVSCATAAGPALEGANIRFGMRACEGAIDHVWLEEDKIRFSTIGNADPNGICGSGLIDAVAAFLELGKINARGRIALGMERDGERILPITDNIYLTQEDIRQVQLAKGAICAGIRLMMQHMGVSFKDIDQCMLAGAFGTYLNPKSACRIGLLPPELLGKIRPVGNTALEGAEIMAKNPDVFRLSDKIVSTVEPLELASLPDFAKTYAANMRF